MMTSVSKQYAQQTLKYTQLQNLGHQQVDLEMGKCMWMDPKCNVIYLIGDHKQTKTLII